MIRELGPESLFLKGPLRKARVDEDFFHYVGHGVHVSAAGDGAAGARVDLARFSLLATLGGANIPVLANRAFESLVVHAAVLRAAAEASYVGTLSNPYSFRATLVAHSRSRLSNASMSEAMSLGLIESKTGILIRRKYWA